MKRLWRSDLKIPAHVAIIMDGNGRWAQARGKSRSFGHARGLEIVDRIVTYANRIGIKHLTLYAFSTENWKRPLSEISFLMSIFEKKLKEYIIKNDNEIKLNLIGNKSELSDEINNLSEILRKKSEKNQRLTLNLAINYGARKEILNSTVGIVEKCLRNDLNLSKIDEKTFSDHLYTRGQPDVDLLIRTGGEFRISNFLLWQISYAELIFLEKLWPDFTEGDLDAAIEEFNKRKRRFGGI